MKVIKELRNKLIIFYDNLTNADLSWSRQYDFYLIFGQTDPNKSPWIKNNWKSDFEPFFELLIKQSDNLKETGLRVVKYLKSEYLKKTTKNLSITTT